MTTRIFIVDDHAIVIEGIRALLQPQKNLTWVGHALDATSCLDFLENNVVDVILMDINLPDKSGLDLCREVKQRYPNVHVIGLSTFNQQSYIRNMIDNGASGYVLKNATGEELLEAIQTVLQGKIYYSSEAEEVLKNHDQVAVVITRREKEVLLLIMEGLTNAEIAEKLFISVTTVDTHRKNLLAKFNVRNIAALITTAMRLQLI